MDLLEYARQRYAKRRAEGRCEKCDRRAVVPYKWCAHHLRERSGTNPLKLAARHLDYVLACSPHWQADASAEQ